MLQSFAIHVCHTPRGGSTEEGLCCQNADSLFNVNFSLSHQRWRSMDASHMLHPKKNILLVIFSVFPYALLLWITEQNLIFKLRASQMLGDKEDMDVIWWFIQEQIWGKHTEDRKRGGESWVRIHVGRTAGSSGWGGGQETDEGERLFIAVLLLSSSLVSMRQEWCKEGRRKGGADIIHLLEFCESTLCPC